MKNKVIILIILVLILSLLRVYSTNYIRGRQQQVQSFKSWLNDTLSVLNTAKTTEKDKSMGLQAVLVSVETDSASVNITKKFFLKVTPNSNGKYAKYINSIIALLKEYKEYPKTSFTLKMETSDFYYSSISSGRVYEYVLEIPIITVETLNSITEYKYIRGRLSGKKTKVRSTYHSETTTKIEFIWNGKKLIKKIVS